MNRENISLNFHETFPPTLRYIADQIEQGYHSGVCPDWALKKGKK